MFRIPPLLLCLPLTGCIYISSGDYKDRVDPDGDGYSLPADCDDNNAEIHPGAAEICDGLDNNCDGQIDEPNADGTWYADADGDGYGDATASVAACDAADGNVHNNTDCDDANVDINPSADETCNGIDDNCSGDESDADDATTWYADADGDTYGDPDTRTTECGSIPTGSVADDTDCDDSDPDIHPGAEEICGNGIDDSCTADDNSTCRLGDTNMATATDVATFTLGSSSEELGYGLSSAGDQDGNGTGDILIGSDNAADDVGQVYLVLNPTTGAPDLSTALILTGESAGDLTGKDVAYAGVVDKGSSDDLLIGAEMGDFRDFMDGGQVYLVGGPVTASGSLTGIAETVLYGGVSDARAGASVDAGDVNADGYSDLLIGSDSNQAWLVLGSPDGLGGELNLSTAADLTLTGESTETYAGRDVAFVGDINGDGYGDWAVAASDYHGPCGTDCGRIYVVLGADVLPSSSHFIDAADWVLTGADGYRAGAGRGIARARMGSADVDGDGYDDLLIGTSDYDTTDGVAYLILGHDGVSVDATPADEASATFVGDSYLSSFVNIPGDVDGDTHADLLIGSGHTNQYAWLYYGSETPRGTFDGTTSDIVHLTGSGATYYDINVAGAGDVDNDGTDDILVRGDGAVYLVFAPTF